MPDLGALIDNNLVTVHEKAGDEPRWGMLDVIREYAREQAQEARPESDRCRRAASDRLRKAFAEAAEPELGRAKQEAWYRRLQAEQDNMRAAIAWALDREERPFSRNASLGALWLFWRRHGDYPEARLWLDRALAADEVRPSFAKRPRFGWRLRVRRRLSISPEGALGGCLDQLLPGRLPACPSRQGPRPATGRGVRRRPGRHPQWADRAGHCRSCRATVQRCDRATRGGRSDVSCGLRTVAPRDFAPGLSGWRPCTASIWLDPEGCCRRRCEVTGTSGTSCSLPGRPDISDTSPSCVASYPVPEGVCCGELGARFKRSASVSGSPKGSRPCRC